jgi:hypothetical protein
MKALRAQSQSAEPEGEARLGETRRVGHCLPPLLLRQPEAEGIRTGVYDSKDCLAASTHFFRQPNQARLRKMTRYIQ